LEIGKFWLKILHFERKLDTCPNIIRFIRPLCERISGDYRRFLSIEKQKQHKPMVELTGLGDEQHKKIGALSKGYRQRVGLAQALIHDPQVLILDEPTTRVSIPINWKISAV
jgi:ABC-type multidrug transport system ATPase subunit